MRSSHGQTLGALRHEVWVVLATAAAAGFVYNGVLSTVSNLYYLRMGYGPEVVGNIAGLRALAFALAALPAAALGRRLGAPRAMVIGLVAWVLAGWIFSVADLVPEAWRLIFLLSMGPVVAAAYAIPMVNLLPILAGNADGSQRPLAFALFASCTPLGAFVGSWLAGLLPGWFASILGSALSQPRPYGLTIGVCYVVLVPVVVAFLRLPEQRPAQMSQSAAQDQPAAQRAKAPLAALVAIGLVSWLYLGGQFTARTFYNVYLDRVLAVSTARIGASMAIASLLAIPAPLVMPALVRRLGKIPALLLTLAGLALTGLLLSLSTDWIMAAAAYAGIIMLVAAVNAVWSLVTQESVSREWRSVSSGVYSLTSGLGAAMMSAGGGYLVGWIGYQALFRSGAGLVVLAAVVAGLFFGRRRPGRAGTESL